MESAGKAIFPNKVHTQSPLQQSTLLNREYLHQELLGAQHAGIYSKPRALEQNPTALH